MHKVSRPINRRRVGRLGSVPASGEAGGAPLYSVEAAAFFLYVEDDLGSTITTPRKVLIDETIIALKAAGIYQNLDVLYVLAAENTPTALTNWINPSGGINATNENGSVFTIDRGYKGDGATSRINTNFQPSVATHLLQDSASVWAWTLSNESSNSDIGGGFGSPVTRFTTQDGLGSFIGGMNSSEGTETTENNGIGFFGLDRADSEFMYPVYNGNNFGELAAFSDVRNNRFQWIGGANPSRFSAKQFAMGAFGSSLSGKWDEFYTIMLNYMQEVGAV